VECIVAKFQISKKSNHFEPGESLVRADSLLGTDSPTKFHQFADVRGTPRFPGEFGAYSRRNRRQHFVVRQRGVGQDAAVGETEKY
jgi:hypothetical protein